MKAAKQLLQDVKAYIPPLEFYRTELPSMRPGGRSDWHDGGLCPLHEDHHAGSFHVNLQTGAFKCFSCKKGGGDIISFIQVRDGLSFLEALQKLADEWGV